MCLAFIVRVVGERLEAFTMWKKILLVFFLGPFLGSLGQDSQILTFLLNEMSSYRTELNSLRADFRDLQTELSKMKMTNAELKQQNSLLNNTLTGLNSKTNNLEKEIRHNISLLKSDLVTVDKSANVSVMYLQIEYQVLEKRLEATLKNVSIDIDFLKRDFDNGTKSQNNCCSSLQSMFGNFSLQDLNNKVNGIQSTVDKTTNSVNLLVGKY